MEGEEDKEGGNAIARTRSARRSPKGGGEALPAADNVPNAFHFKSSPRPFSSIMLRCDRFIKQPIKVENVPNHFEV